MKNMGSLDTMDGTKNKDSMEAKNNMKNKEILESKDDMENKEILESKDDMEDKEILESKGDMEDKEILESRDDMDNVDNVDEMGSTDSDEMDILLKAAFSQMVEQEYEKRPKEFPKHQFSPQFEHSMEEILRTGRMADKAEKKDKREFSMLALLRPIRSRRAVLAMVVLMVCLFGATVSGTNPIIVWLHDSWMEQHGDYVEIENREKGSKRSDEAFQKYELTQIPEGYQLVEELFDESIGIYYLYYVNEEEDTFTFRQSMKDNKNLGNITANRKDMEQVKVGEFEGYYVKDSDNDNFILSNAQYMLIFTGNLSKEEFLAMAEGLQIAE